MAITTLTKVKTIARAFTLSGVTPPATSTVGELGDVYLDTVTGLTYELTDILPVLIPIPSTTYVWDPVTRFDAEILLQIDRAERDYLNIRGVPFEEDNLGALVYPNGADVVAAEMVCYLMGLGRFSGRGMQSASLGGRSGQYETKIFGYPVSIVSAINRYMRVM
jgi:hypothetical protein